MMKLANWQTQLVQQDEPWLDHNFQVNNLDSEPTGDVPFQYHVVSSTRIGCDPIQLRTLNVLVEPPPISHTHLGRLHQTSTSPL